MAVQKNFIFIISNGSIKKIPRCNIQLLRREDSEDNDAINDDEDTNQETPAEEAGKTNFNSGNTVNFDLKDEENFGENINSEEIR